MSRNAKFGTNFKLDARQLNYKLQVISGAFVSLIESGILEVATEDQKKHIQELFMVLETYHTQVMNEALDMKDLEAAE